MRLDFRGDKRGDFRPSAKDRQGREGRKRAELVTRSLILIDRLVKKQKRARPSRGRQREFFPAELFAGDGAFERSAAKGDEKSANFSVKLLLSAMR